VSDQSVFNVLGLNSKSIKEDGAYIEPDKVFMEKYGDGTVKMRIERHGRPAEYISQSDFIRKVPGGFGLKVSDNNSQDYFSMFNQFADMKRGSKDFQFDYNTMGNAPAVQPQASGNQGGKTVSINDLPVGAKVTTKKGKNYYNGMEVVE